jgi:allantoinase
MYDLLVSGGKLVSADRIFEGNIAVRNGKFAAFFEKEDCPDAKERINAGGNYVFPGIIDCHAHLNEPGFTYREDFATGSRAAAAGGTTTLIDMPLNNEPPLTNKEVFALKHGLIDKTAVVDYALWGGLVDYNLGDLIDLYKCGVVAMKGFVCPCSGSFTNVNMGQVKEALELLKPYKALCGFHCEEYGTVLEMENKAKAEGRDTIRDFLDAHSVITELLATRNIIDLCRETGGRVHICHVSHPAVAEIVKQAIAEGLPLSAETCPHYLGFTEDLVLEKGAPAKCTPPLRTADAVEGLWSYVLDGTLSCIGSDHSPAADEEKDNSKHTIWTAWGGLNAIQLFLPMMFNMAVHQRGLIPTLLARVMGKNPAKLFGLYGRKGGFEIGFDADMVILDPEKPWKVSKEMLLTKNKVSAFEGVSGKGFPIRTIVRGKTVAQNGKNEDVFGYGELLRPIAQ